MIADIDHLWRGIKRDAAWQLVERASRIGLGFVVGLLIARDLGPEAFGLYSYALSMVALFAFLGQAGLDALLLRQLVRDPSRAGRTLTEGMALRIAGAALAGVGAVTLAIASETRETAPARSLVAIVAIGGLFQASFVIESWLQAIHRFDSAAKAKISAYVVAAIARLMALRASQPLTALAIVTVLESALCALLLWAAARRSPKERVALLAPTTSGMRSLWTLAWPMLLSALTVAIYSRIDVVMLGRMSGRESVGIYSAGSLLSEGFTVIPAAVMAAASPRLAALFVKDSAAFQHSLHALIRLLSFCGLAVAIATATAAPWIVPLLFGPEFQASAAVLQVHVWAIWIVFISVASDPWYINHDLRRYYLAKTSAAAALNVLLNLVLIPDYGAVGAAWATVMSYTVSALGMSLLWSATRPLASLQLRAMTGLPSPRTRHYEEMR